MTKKRQAVDERRIYVIVPETVQVFHARKVITSIPMEPGRLMAQCAHVVGKMRLDEAAIKYDRGVPIGADKNQALHYAPITTIVLSVRNSRELLKVTDALAQAAGYYNDSAAHQREFPFNIHEFFDTNPALYGRKMEVRTAVCTSPVKPHLVDAALGHLELYTPRG